MDQPTQAVIAQIDSILGRVEELLPKSKYDDLSDLPEATLLEMHTLALATIDRIAPEGTAYRRSAAEIVEHWSYGPAIVHLTGVLRALRADYEAGYIHTVTELIHANVFADFLDMATHLLESGYRDAAAVIAGSTLEAHIRKLCEKAEINLNDGQGKPRKADSLNADLGRAGVYNLLQQKSVTAWLGLRNDAAHGHYERYDAPQVDSLIRDVRAFMIRLPA